MAGIFKAYDIRGIVGKDLDENLARWIGGAFAAFLGCRQVVVGRDMRPHSGPLFEALVDGLTRQGVDVIDLGMVSTPMLYYAVGLRNADAGIMITASHNGAEWNGFKMCRDQAIPISGATGIQEIEHRVRSRDLPPEAPAPGIVRAYDVKPAYIEHVRQFADLRRPVRIAVDFANAMGIAENRVFDGLLDMDFLFDEYDGSFPNHEANPLKAETFDALSAAVRDGDFDFGIAYDGDADRVGFTDERGTIIPMDMITALIAQTVLKRQPGSTIYYDLRSSWAVKEVIEESGGRPLMSRVGHAFIKQQMREQDAIFAGELSGHYYFRENYYTESSALAVLLVANLASQSDVPISELVAPIHRYIASGEINSRVADPEDVLKRLQEAYPGGRMLHLDGLSIEFEDWWFNVRASNTEPLIRLNLEAKTRQMMEQRRDEVLGVVRGLKSEE